MITQQEKEQCIAVIRDEDIEEPTTAKPEDNSNILRRLEDSRYDETLPPPDNPPIASLNDIGVLWKGNVHTLVAGSKVGKSRFLAALIKSLVRGERSLGWSENLGGKKVIYLDFEQDREDFYDAMHNQAGVTRDEVYAYNMPGFSATDAVQAVELLLDRHQDASVLLVDGVADLCNDVNDPEESNALVAHLMNLTVKYDVANLGVLHLNPGSDTKSRGHLGSQLERKSKTVIQLTSDIEGTRTAYTKLARKRPILEKDGVQFVWCDEEGNFMELTETKSQKKQRIDAGEHRERMARILEGRTLKAFTHKELLKVLMAETDKSESTCKTMIRKMIDLEVMDKTGSDYSVNEDPKILEMKVN